ncbi:MAG: hypothetical protein EAX81_01300 [Candidatus Thorarchaeota archaeon]|nr:hypothetical protein [Candidatus Thorarchaeota archaeon]
MTYISLLDNDLLVLAVDTDSLSVGCYHCVSLRAMIGVFSDIMNLPKKKIKTMAPYHESLPYIGPMGVIRI